MSRRRRRKSTGSLSGYIDGVGGVDMAYLKLRFLRPLDPDVTPELLDEAAEFFRESKGTSAVAGLRATARRLRGMDDREASEHYSREVREASE